MRSRLTFSNVVSVIALFVAIGGGTAFALQGKNSVRSDDIARGQVKSGDLARNSVTGVKVRDRAIGSSELSPAVRPLRFQYVRGIGSGGQEEVVQTPGFRLQASCESDGGRPRLRAFVIPSQSGFLDLMGVGSVADSIPLVMTSIPLAPGNPQSVTDLTPDPGVSARFGALISVALGSSAASVNYFAEANDVTDACAIRGTVMPVG